MGDSPHIIIPRHSRNKPQAIIRIIAHEGGRLEIETEFNPPVPDARHLHWNPAAEIAMNLLIAGQQKNVIKIKSHNNGAGIVGTGNVNCIPTDKELG